MSVELELFSIFATGSYLLMTGLLAATLYFLIAGVKTLREEHMEGVLFIALGIFFGFWHIYYLVNLPADSQIGAAVQTLDLWRWLVLLCAPAIIALYVLFGLLHLVSSQLKASGISVFFGLSLALFLFQLGISWPLDVRGIMVVAWSALLVNIQLDPVL